MAASDFPELNKMPAQCRNTLPWGSTLLVMMPYEDVSSQAVEQRPLVSDNIFVGEAKYDQDTPEGLGYQSAVEKKNLTRLRGESSALKHNVAFYHPQAKDTIVDLATQANDLLDEILDIYRDYDQKKYKIEATGQYVNYPLSVPDDKVPVPPIAKASRPLARQKIRDNYHKALHFLWCATYGKNQSLSWRANKKLHGEQAAKMGFSPTAPSTGPTLTPATPQPPPPGVDVSPQPPQPPPPPYDVSPQPIPPPPPTDFEPAQPPGPGPVHEPPPPDLPPGTSGGEPWDDDTLPQMKKTKRKKAPGANVAAFVAITAGALYLATR